MKKYAYLILLLVTCLAGTPMAISKLREKEAKESEPIAVSSASVQDAKSYKQPQSDSFKNIEDETERIESPEPEQTAPEQTAPEQPAPEQTAPEQPASESVPPEQTVDYTNPSFIQVDRTYFADALFIGDSRTMGLEEYADLGNADIFAGSGMSVFKLFETKNDTGRGKTYLEDILNSKAYGKIYFMMGINDLGYDFTRLEEQYGRVITRIQEMQPGAKMFLQANMHVTPKKSAGDAIFNNDSINRLNAVVKALAEGKGCIYLDVNEKFDDGTGALSSDLTNDEVHVLGKHYQEWADWICTKGVL